MPACTHLCPFFTETTGMAYWHRTDREGRPVIVFRMGHHDPERFSAETTVRYVIWKLEQGIAMEGVDTVTRVNLSTCDPSFTLPAASVLLLATDQAIIPSITLC